MASDDFRDDIHDDEGPDTGSPVSVLSDFAVDPDPGLEGRVVRSIQRRELASDTLDFSLRVMIQTAWEYLRSLLDLVPAGDDRSGKE